MTRILVIDHDRPTQSLLTAGLRAQGYEVITAYDGDEGITKAKQLGPELIICDWMMPGKNGLEVCQELKADPELCNSYFILLTSYCRIEQRVTGLDAGADDFLAKPVALRELQARIRAGLRWYKSKQELKKLAQELQSQKQLLEAELATAAEYIKSLLPTPSIEPVHINHHFLPSRQLGGDCFDYYWLDPDYLMIYLLDVSGHGLGSALPSVFVQNLLRSQALRNVNFYQPHQVLAALNEVFRMSEHNYHYFTIWYGVYNQKKRQLTYASAGHPPAVLLGKDSSQKMQAKLLKTRGAPIGMRSDAKYQSEYCNIEPGSTLYIFSDGVYEIRRKNGLLWNLDSFIDFLTELNTHKNLCLEELITHIKQLKGTDTFEDDCSILQLTLL